MTLKQFLRPLTSYTNNDHKGGKSKLTFGSTRLTTKSFSGLKFCGTKSSVFVSFSFGKYSKPAFVSTQNLVSHVSKKADSCFLTSTPTLRMHEK